MIWPYRPRLRRWWVVSTEGALAMDYRLHRNACRLADALNRGLAAQGRTLRYRVERHP